MKKQNQFKKQTILLFFAGTLCMSFTLLTRHFFETPIDVDDFLKGLGVAFMISALFVQKKLETEINKRGCPPLSQKRFYQKLRVCLERVRYENQGVVVLAKLIVARLAGQISNKKRRQSLHRRIAGFISP